MKRTTSLHFLLPAAAALLAFSASAGDVARQENPMRPGVTQASVNAGSAVVDPATPPADLRPKVTARGEGRFSSEASSAVTTVRVGTWGLDAASVKDDLDARIERLKTYLQEIGVATDGLSVGKDEVFPQDQARTLVPLEFRPGLIEGFLTSGNNYVYREVRLPLNRSSDWQRTIRTIWLYGKWNRATVRTEYDYPDAARVRAEAMERAKNSAEEKARVLAETSGAKLGKIVEIKVENVESHEHWTEAEYKSQAAVSVTWAFED